MQKKKSTLKKATHNNNQIRIIGGDWRGRKLSFPSINGLRPTGDRIRETLFNWLAPEITGIHCADLFAGSGALGFEALSRGSNRVDLVEVDGLAANSLRRNLELLGCERGQVFQQDSETYLDTKKQNSLDLVFLDPPFAHKLHNQMITHIQNSGVMRKKGMIYIEAPTNAELMLPDSWHLQKEKSSGQVCYRLFSVN